MNIESLLNPIDVRSFVTRYWEQAPLHIPRTDSTYFDSLFSLADADSLLQETGGLSSNHIHVVINGSKASPSALNTPESNRSASGIEALYQAYRSGATLIIGSIQHHWRPVRALAHSMATDLTANVNVNGYLTPPRASGFAVHYDTHDVLILQTAGVKHWRIFAPPIALPLPSEPYTKSAAEMTGAAMHPLIEVDLQPGSTLYIPRGFLHDAHSLESTSLHLTVGMYVPTLGSTLISALSSVVQANPALRASLPFGFGRDEQVRGSAKSALEAAAQEVVSRISLDAALEETALNVGLFRPPSLEGHLLDLDSISTITMHSRVRKRAECEWRIRRTQNR
jgi:ribosomal protein L16 Arg81 hydroxylase